MAERVTQRDLEAVCARVNRTFGESEAAYRRDDGGQWTAVVGSFTLDGAYGGWALYRITSEGGGCFDVLGIGHVPRRELRDAIFAFLRGVELWEDHEREAVTS